MALIAGMGAKVVPSPLQEFAFTIMINTKEMEVQRDIQTLTLHFMKLPVKVIASITKLTDLSVLYAAIDVQSERTGNVIRFFYNESFSSVNSLMYKPKHGNPIANWCLLIHE